MSDLTEQDERTVLVARVVNYSQMAETARTRWHHEVLHGIRPTSGGYIGFYETATRGARDALTAFDQEHPAVGSTAT